MNSKVLLVARREWLENVKTKAFWFGILIVPVLIVAAMTIPAILEKNKEAREYVVVDRSGFMLEEIDRFALRQDIGILLGALARGDEELESKLPEVWADAAGDPVTAAERLANDPNVWDWWSVMTTSHAQSLHPALSKARFRRVEADPDADLNARVAAKELFAYFVIGEDPINNPNDNRYVSRNLTDNDLQRWFEGLATEVLRLRRMEARDVDPELAAWLDAEANFVPTRVSESGEEAQVTVNDRLRQMAPAAFVYLLWLSIFTVAQMLLANTIEEKSNRLMEVLLSSVSPLQLMLGKIIGIAATGMTMVGTWIACLVAAILVAPKVLGSANMKMDFGFILGDPAYLVAFAAYFVLGYLLYAAILVAIGSVCNSLKEAQNMQSPVVILLMIPLFLMIPIARDPDGTLATVSSYIPPLTPFVMMNRAAGSVSTLEYVLTTALLIVSVILAIWAAAKVFRIGVLMTGKPPSLKEMWRWIRAPIGKVPHKKDEAESTP